MNFVLFIHLLLIATLVVGFGSRYLLVVFRRGSNSRGRYPLFAALLTIIYAGVVLASIGKLSSLMVFRDALICSTLSLALEFNLNRISSHPDRLEQTGAHVISNSN